MPTLLSIGECMIELAPAEGGTLQKSFAGDTFNTAWYARAGLPSDWQVEYLTTLGNDPLSEEMLAFFGSAGVRTTFVTRAPSSSVGLYLVAINNGERSFSYWRGESAAKGLAEDRDNVRAALNAADAVYFSGITLAILPPDDRAFLVDAVQAQRDRGKFVAFDPNIRPKLWTSASEMRAEICRGAAAASLVLPSFADEVETFGDTDPLATEKRYRDLGANSVVVKDGANGAWISQGRNWMHVPAYPVADVVDTTGAGDSFNGAYMAEFLVCAAPAAAAGSAVCVAAQVVSNLGALIQCNPPVNFRENHSLAL